MKNEYSLDEYIQLQVIEEEKNYDHALFAGKSIQELKSIQDRIDYLKCMAVHIRHRYGKSISEKA